MERFFGFPLRFSLQQPFFMPVSSILPSCLLATALLVFNAKAVVNVSLDSLTGVAPNADLIASDPTRDGLAVELQLHTASNASPANDGASIRVRFSLVDETDAPQQLQLPGGGTGSFIEVTRGLNFPTGTIATGLSWNKTETFSTEFSPVNRLRPGDRFRAKAEVQRNDAGNWVTLGTYIQTTGQRIWHFPSLDSNDASPNVNADALSATLTSPYIIRSMPGQLGFQVNYSVLCRRYDHFQAASPGSSAITIPLRFTLHDLSNNADIPLLNPLTTESVTMSEFSVGAGPTQPVQTLLEENHVLIPLNIADVDPLRVYEIRMEVGHAGEAAFTPDSQKNLTPQNLLALSGKLKFGSLVTNFSQLDANPIPGMVVTANPAAHAAGTLELAAGSGTLPGLAHQFGGSIPVEILLNGDAVFSGTTGIPVTGPVPDEANVSGTTVTRSTVTLGATGAVAGNITVKLPRGLGFTTTAGNRVLKNKFSQQNVPLNASLLPSTVSKSGSPTLFLSMERFPMVFGAAALQFDFASGQFSFTPTTALFDTAFELATLEGAGAANLLNWPAGVPLHAGNDQLFRFAKVSGTDVFQISTGANGAAFVNSARLEFMTGLWWTHFPRQWLISAAGPHINSSQYVVLNDVVDAASFLGFTGANGTYTPDCKPENQEANQPQCDPASMPKFNDVAFNLINNTTRILRFHTDGSAYSDVAMQWSVAAAPATSIPWGTISLPAPGVTPKLAHSVEINEGANPVIKGRLMLPTHFQPFVPSVFAAEQAAASLLSGRGFSNGNEVLEHPGTPGYLAGETDYAGFNIRASELPELDGASRIGGGNLVGYDLLGQTKLYLRPAGVSGAIQSETPLGPMPVNGYGMSFEGMKLSFLDNNVAGSKLNGGLTVGSSAGPSEFTLQFKNLLLHCNGALDRGDVSPGQDPKQLAYWRTTVNVLSIDFVQPAPCAGPGATTFLALGCSTNLPALTQDSVLTGVLGFRPNGSLVARADGDNDFAVTGLDSRFRVPGNIKLKGPGSSHYSLTPVSGVYLNRWPGAEAQPAVGYASIAGAVDVPFFENLAVHLHASAGSAANTPTQINIMKAVPQAGPFDVAGFDPENIGVPNVPGLTLDNYRSEEAYFPVASRSKWAGLLDFSYPVEWRPAQREFQMRSGHEVVNNLYIASAKSRLRSLSPTTADLKFKATAGLDLPSISPAKLMAEALEGANADSLIPSFNTVIPQFDELIKKLNSIDACLADSAGEIVRQPIRGAVDAVFASDPNPSQEDFMFDLATELTARFGVPATNSGGWKWQVFAKLDTLQEYADSMAGYIENIETMRSLAVAAATILGGTPPPDLPDEVKEMLNKAYGVMKLVSAGVTKAKTTIEAISVSPDWESIVVSSSFEAPIQPASAADLAAEVETRFLGTDVGAKLAEEMRIHLSHLRDFAFEATDDAFAALNEALQGAGGDVDALGVPNVPSLEDLQFGKIDGYARITGDSLHELSLAADLNLKLGLDLGFHGSVLFRDLQSDTPAGACRLNAGIASELTVTAGTSIPFGLPKTQTKLEVGGKFAFDASGSLDGLSGRFGMASEAGFKLGPLTIKQAELGFGFGGGDAYLYGKGAGKSDYADIEAAVLLGRCCNFPQVLARVDEHVSDLINHPDLAATVNLTNPPNPVYGIYAFGYGTISVNALIGIPPSCMLNLKAGTGMGAFAFTTRDANNNYDGIIGLRTDLGISGEVLCIADIGARISLVGGAPFQDASDITEILSSFSGDIFGHGAAVFEVEIGVDPFSVNLSKTLEIDFRFNPAEPTLDFDLDL